MTSRAVKHLHLSVDGGIATVTMNRPPANALNLELMAEFEEVAEALSGTGTATSGRVRAVLLRSALPGIFMAGADLGMLDGSWDTMLHTIRAFHQAGNAWERIPCPTIAVIGGHAAGGGCELALTCDFRLMASGRPTIGLPEVKLGLLASGGGTQRMARLVGRGTAMDLLLRGRMVTGEEAAAVGLVTEAVEAEQLEDRARSLAEELAALPPLAVAEIKRCVLEGLEGHLSAGLALEERANLALATTEDAQEGVRAFVERRPPKFVGA